MKNYIFGIILLILCTIYILCDIEISNFSNSYTIPKIVWSHWGSDNFESMPLSIKQIVNDRNKKLESKNWRIVMLNNNNVKDYIDKNEYPPKYNTLTIQAQSDWLRLKLLQKYGGLWIDAGIIINDIDAFEKMYLDCITKQSELTGFYLKDRISNDDPTTYIESWYIMAPLESNIINLWLEQFEKAIDIGFDTYLNKVISTGYQNNGILEFGTYLMIHLCLQMALKEMNNMPNVLLYNSEDTMFKLHVDCKWVNECVKNNLKYNKEVKKIPYIKLRGVDRIDDMVTYFAN